jgi:hypothetical protein
LRRRLKTSKKHQKVRQTCRTLDRHIEREADNRNTYPYKRKHRKKDRHKGRQIHIKKDRHIERKTDT